MTAARQARTPGPRRPEGTPVGPDEVRTDVVEAAGRLFAERGIDAVSLRDIPAAADVHVALIPRYVGSRDDLVVSVFEHLSRQVADAVRDNPLAGQGYTVDTVMGRWVRVAGALASTGRLPSHADFNPVTAMAATLVAGYDLDERSARVRAAQIVAAALGWRIFDDYLLTAGDLHGLPLAELREDLVHTARRLGATPWPSPPDPEPARHDHDG